MFAARFDDRDFSRSPGTRCNDVEALLPATGYPFLNEMERSDRKSR